MNKLSKEKRDKLMLIGLGTAGVLAAIYLLIIGTQQAALAACAEKTDSARDRLGKAEHWLRMAPGIQARLDACRKELELRQEGMAPPDKFKWFYNTMEKFLAQRRVKLVDISREPEVGSVGVLPKFPYRAASFSVKLVARYQDLGLFLADFENQFPYMRVQNFQIEPEVNPNLGLRDGAVPENSVPSSNDLTISMRIVTLIKPTDAF